MCTNCTCNSTMTLDEAIRIAEMCRSDMNPPTNPNVLLKAAQVICKEKGICEDLYSILSWTMDVIESGCFIC